MENSVSAVEEGVSNYKDKKTDGRYRIAFLNELGNGL